MEFLCYERINLVSSTMCPEIRCSNSMKEICTTVGQPKTESGVSSYPPSYSKENCFYQYHYIIIIILMIINIIIHIIDNYHYHFAVTLMEIEHVHKNKLKSMNQINKIT